MITEWQVVECEYEGMSLLSLVDLEHPDPPIQTIQMATEYAEQIAGTMNNFEKIGKRACLALTNIRDQNESNKHKDNPTAAVFALCAYVLIDSKQIEKEQAVGAMILEVFKKIKESSSS